MTKAAVEILETFDRLPAEERDEVVTLILRKVAMEEHEAPTDEDLVHSASLVFAELDRTESSE